jgi:biopolymer transport protein ExbD
VSETRAGTGSRRHRRRRARRSDLADVLDIPVTPMIDVMMCLLVIFMVITPVITYYGAKVPGAVHFQRASVEDAISIGVRNDGTLYLGQDTVTANVLAQRLDSIYENRPGDHLLYLWADADLRYARVLDVLEGARHAGVRTVGAIVGPPENAAKSGATAPAKE